MNKIFYITLTAICGVAALQADGGGYDQNPDIQQIQGNDVIWIGPGWYGGMWLANEDEFNEWQNGYNHGNYNRRGSYHGRGGYRGEHYQRGRGDAHRAGGAGHHGGGGHGGHR